MLSDTEFWKIADAELQKRRKKQQNARMLKKIHKTKQEIRLILELLKTEALLNK